MTTLPSIGNILNHLKKVKMTSSAPENATMIERECDHYDQDGKSGKSTVDHIESNPIPTNPGNKGSCLQETISSEIVLSSEVRGEVASPLTYAKTAKIRGGVPPMLKSQPHFLLGASN